MHNYTVQYGIEGALEEKEVSEAQSNTKALLDLAALGIDRVVLSYNGSGDSGCIEEVNAYKGENEVSLNETLKDWAEGLIYAMLPGGWEINEGSSGEARIHVYNRSIEIRHSDNIISTVESDINGEIEVTGDFREQLSGQLLPGREVPKPKKKGSRKENE